MFRDTFETTVTSAYLEDFSQEGALRYDDLFARLGSKQVSDSEHWTEEIWQSVVAQLREAVIAVARDPRLKVIPFGQIEDILRVLISEVSHSMDTADIGMVFADGGIEFEYLSLYQEGSEKFVWEMKDGSCEIYLNPNVEKDEDAIRLDYYIVPQETR